MPDTRLILHVKGSENQTAELPKNIVRAAIAQGQITRSQLIWSTAHNAWKQVRELPHLLPSQKLAPAPVPRVITGPLPVVAPAGQQTGAVPRVTVKASAGAPVARAAVVAKAPSESLVVEEERGGINPIKWLCIGLSILIVGVVAANYFFINQPIANRLASTPYASVTVFAHLGAFVQPNALVIHIPNSPAVNESNLSDFLVNLAHSTDQPLSLYERISLTSGLMSDYTITGISWKQLGQMGQDSKDQQVDFLLDQLTDSSGQPLMPPAAPNQDDTARQALRDKAWASLVTHFTKASP